MEGSCDVLLNQLDVETTFLDGTLQEEVYMEQPEGFEQKGKETLVCRLHKSIYGLKQSPMCWNTVLDEYLRQMEFVQTSGDPCVYVSARISELMILAVYVDDLLLTGQSQAEIDVTKKELSTRFRMKDLGKLHHFLGMEVIQDLIDGTVWFGQTAYTNTLLLKYGMEESKSASTPSDHSSKLVKRDEEENDGIDITTYQAAVGGLLYLSTKTRPDIAFAVGNAARFCASPGKDHWTAVKRIFRYLRGTSDLGLRYHRQGTGFVCDGYAAADWAGSLDDRKSTSGYVFKFGDAAVSWKSHKQTCTGGG